jgi:hypothetical protein
MTATSLIRSSYLSSQALGILTSPIRAGFGHSLTMIFSRSFAYCP